MKVVFGWVGDMLPRRHALFLFGLLILLVATVILAFGRQIEVLIVGRLLQGLSAAVTWTSGLAMLTDIFGQERYGEAVGYAQTSVSVGTTSAPLLGGIVYAWGGYSTVSAMSIGTITISLALALLMLEPKVKAGWDESAPALPVAGKTYEPVAPGEVSKIRRGMPGPPALEPASELPDERTNLIPRSRKYRPAYPLLLRSGRVLAAMGGILIYSFVIISFESLIPLFVKETFHWDSTHAALIFLAWIIPGFLGSLAGRASDRLGSRWVAVGGLLFSVPPLALMRFVTEDSTSHKVLLCGMLTLVGKCFLGCSFCGARPTPMKPVN